MYLADAKFHDAPNGFFTFTADQDQTEAFFKGSGHTFAEMTPWPTPPGRCRASTSSRT